MVSGKSAVDSFEMELPMLWPIRKRHPKLPLKKPLGQRLSLGISQNVKVNAHLHKDTVLLKGGCPETATVRVVV